MIGNGDAAGLIARAERRGTERRNETRRQLRRTLGRFLAEPDMAADAVLRCLMDGGLIPRGPVSELEELQWLDGRQDEQETNLYRRLG